VKAIEQLRNMKETELLMIGPDKGDGSYLKVKQKISNSELEDIIQIIPGVSKAEIPNYLSKYDIFINTTNVESFGQSVLEAAACGLCIVTTNVGELPFLWEHEVDALLIPPDDPEAMADAIQRILTEPGLAARLSTNARKKAEQFDWSIILPQWEALFEEVMKSSE
jgi:glycosyltransferase involved in cell wall biosynthesis